MSETSEMEEECHDIMIEIKSRLSSLFYERSMTEPIDNIKSLVRLYHHHLDENIIMNALIGAIKGQHTGGTFDKNRSFKLIQYYINDVIDTIKISKCQKDRIINRCLHISLILNKTDLNLVRYLIGMGASEIDDALICASVIDNVEIIKHLLSIGANKVFKAFIYAVDNGSYNTIKYLIDVGVISSCHLKFACKYLSERLKLSAKYRRMYIYLQKNNINHKISLCTKITTNNENKHIKFLQDEKNNFDTDELLLLEPHLSMSNVSLVSTKSPRLSMSQSSNLLVNVQEELSSDYNIKRTSSSAEYFTIDDDDDDNYVADTETELSSPPRFPIKVNTI